MTAPIRFKINDDGPEHRSVGITISAPGQVEPPGKTLTIKGRYTIPSNAIIAAPETSLHSHIIVTNIACSRWVASTRRCVEIPVPISKSNETIKDGLRYGEFEVDTFETITRFDPDEAQIFLVSIGPYVSNPLLVRSKAK